MRRPGAVAYWFLEPDAEFLAFKCIARDVGLKSRDSAIADNTVHYFVFREHTEAESLNKFLVIGFACRIGIVAAPV